MGVDGGGWGDEIHEYTAKAQRSLGCSWGYPELGNTKLALSLAQLSPSLLQLLILCFLYYINVHLKLFEATIAVLVPDIYISSIVYVFVVVVLNIPVVPIV